jgi:hypothetical protein
MAKSDTVKGFRKATVHSMVEVRQWICLLNFQETIGIVISAQCVKMSSTVSLYWWYEGMNIMTGFTGEMLHNGQIHRFRHKT